MQGDLVNYTNETKSVYWVVDVQFVDGKPEGHQEAVTQLWNVGQCDGKTGFNAPKPKPGQSKFALASKNMTMVQDGTFLAFRKSSFEIHVLHLLLT